MSTDYDRVASLHGETYMLPWDHISTNVIPGLVFVTVSLTLLFNVHLGIQASKSLDVKQQRKSAYQFTNLCVNAVLGGLGVYYFMKLPSDLTIEEQIIGFDEFYPLSCLQIGFQLWAIPVGLFYVDESPAMIMHHVSVVIVGFMAGFTHFGFRFFTPFMFGMLELSSVPLAIMNTFKDNPKLIERYPKFYSVIRVLFAIMFLTIRWCMLAPRKYNYLRLNALAILSSPNIGFTLYYSFCWLSAFFLMILQIYWGVLIIKGLTKMFFNTKEKVKER